MFVQMTSGKDGFAQVGRLGVVRSLLRSRECDRLLEWSYFYVAFTMILSAPEVQ